MIFYSDYALSLNPIAHFKLSETSGTQAIDQKGYLTGTYSGGYTMGQASLVPNDVENTCVAFNGSNARITLPNKTNDLTSPVTVVMLVKLDSTKTSGIGSLIELNNLYGGKRLDVDYSTKKLSVYSAYEAATCVSDIGFNTIVHIVAVYDLPNSIRILYLNGVQVASGALAKTAQAYGGCSIGCHATNGYYTKGLIDEVSIFNRALSSTDIETLYALSINPGVSRKIDGVISETLAATYFIARAYDFSTGALEQTVTVNNGSFSFDFGPGPSNKKARLVTVMPDIGYSWKASTVYALNSKLFPTDPVTTPYYYTATVAGTSGATEPNWPTTPGQTVTDGTVTWECVERLVQPITHGPLIPS